MHGYRFGSHFKPLMWFMALLLAAFVAGCGSNDGGSTPASPPSSSGATTVLPGAAGTSGANATDPTVGSVFPGIGATNVPTSTNSAGNILTGTLLTATFTQPMAPATIVSSPAGTLPTFTLKETVAGANVPGTVAMNASNTVATFTPTATALNTNTSYTATVSTVAQSAAGTNMAKSVAWTFTTVATLSTAQAPVNLGTAGNYAIFARTAITNSTACPAPCITGNMGIGPAATSAAIVGFALTLPPGGAFSTSSQVTGNVYAFDYAVPTPSDVSTASLDMGLAYNDAAGRTPATALPFLNLDGGTLATQTLLPGVYTWTTAVSLGSATILTLSGGPNDVWIFQIGGALSTPANSRVQLAGGAVPKNVFWQVNGAVNVGAAPAHFEGVVLSNGAMTVGNQATMTSRLLSQTAVTLDRTTVEQPAP